MRLLVPLVAGALTTMVGCGGGEQARQGGPPGGASPSSSVLVFADEFDGPPGTVPNPDNWVHDLGGSGWGNGELQTYTNRPENASLDGAGNLVITVRREDVNGMKYTSARLTSAGRVEYRYGRFEARIKVPTGQGIWPAFWMLGNNCIGPMCSEGKVRWPHVGEIDILEYLGQKPAEVFGTVHGPGYSGSKSLSATYKLPQGASFHDEFHVFAVDWGPRRMSWSVDGTVYRTLTKREVLAHGAWVFDHPFYMVLNVAVGGGFAGAPDDTTKFPQRMLVDYVRVYAPGTTRQP